MELMQNASGDVVRWNPDAEAWEPVSIEEANNSLLTNVTGNGNGEFVAFNTATQQWQPIAPDKAQSIAAAQETAVTAKQQAIENAPSGFVQGMRDPIDAGAQMLEKALPSGVVDKVNQFNDYLIDEFGIPLQRMGDGGLDASLRRNDSRYQARRKAEGDTGMDWDRLGGNVLSPIGAAAPALRAASGAGKLGLAAGTGAVGGLLSEPVLDGGDFVEEKAKQALAGAAGGGLLHSAARGIANIGERARRPEVTRMRELGVEPTVGQTVGGWMGRGEEALGSIPIVGDAISGARGRAADQFNVAAMNDVVDSIRVLGAQVPSIGRITEPGFAGMTQAYKMMDDAYDYMRTLAPDIRLDRQAVGELDRFKDSLRGQSVDAESAINRFIQNSMDRRLFNGEQFTLDGYAAVDRKLGDRIRSTVSNVEIQTAFKDLQAILRNAATRHSPEYGAVKRAADLTRAKLERVGKASEQALRDDGKFSPAQLLHQSRGQDKSTSRRDTRTGQALMQDFASNAQDVVGNRLANSGTTDRGLWAGLAGGMIDPTLTLAAGTLHGAYMDPVQRALTAGMRQIPQSIGEPTTIGGLFGGYAGEDIFGGLLGQ